MSVESQNEEICRICLKEGNLIPINEKYENANIFEMLQICFSIQIDEEDGLPQKICSICVGELAQAYNLSKKFQTSKTVLNDQKPSPISLIKTIEPDTNQDEFVLPDKSIDIKDIEIGDKTEFVLIDKNIIRKIKDHNGQQEIPSPSEELKLAKMRIINAKSNEDTITIQTPINNKINKQFKDISGQGSKLRQTLLGNRTPGKVNIKIDEKNAKETPGKINVLSVKSYRKDLNFIRGDKTKNITDLQLNSLITNKKIETKNETVTNKKIEKKNETVTNKKIEKKNETVTNKKIEKKTEKVTNKKIERKIETVTNKKIERKTETVTNKKIEKKNETITNKKLEKKNEADINKNTETKNETDATKKTEKINKTSPNKKTINEDETDTNLEKEKEQILANIIEIKSKEVHAERKNKTKWNTRNKIYKNRKNKKLKKKIRKDFLYSSAKYHEQFEKFLSTPTNVVEETEEMAEETEEMVKEETEEMAEEENTDTKELKQIEEKFEPLLPTSSSTTTKNNNLKTIEIKEKIVTGYMRRFKNKKTCPICKKSYKYLEPHLRIHAHKELATLRQMNETKYEDEEDKEKQLVCSICNRKFLHKSTLLKHKELHESDETFNCSVCGKSFKEKSTLQRHFNMHTKNNLYDCDICKKRSYNIKSNLYRHQRVCVKRHHREM